MGPSAVGGTVPDGGVRTPVVVAGPVGEDVGAPVGEGVGGRLVVGVLEVGGGDVPVVLLGWGLGLVGLSMAGAPPEGMVAAGVGNGRTHT